jgi:hypothetical protein
MVTGAVPAGRIHWSSVLVLTSTHCTPWPAGRLAGCTRTPGRINRPWHTFPDPGHPARLRHSRFDGRSPGSRVIAFSRLPGSSPVAFGRGSSLTVAGTAADWKPKVSAPHSLFAPPVAGKGPSACETTRWHAALSTRGNSVATCRTSFIVAPSSVFDENRERECGTDRHVQSRGCPRNCMRLAPPQWPLESDLREGGEGVATRKPGDLPATKRNAKGPRVEGERTKQ